MATNLDFLVNIVDADVDYQITPADYGLVDLTNDYLIWTAGNSIVKDLMTHEPTSSELSAAASIIDEFLAVTVSKCLWMDYSHNIGGTYYTHLVKGMAENKRYVFCFSFDGATATEPQLEAWDDSNHTTFNKNSLGLGTANNSFLKAVCTTYILPGASWVGSPIAGGSNVLLLNGGNGALDILETGEISQELYANMKMVIPANFATPAAENIIITIRYTYS